MPSLTVTVPFTGSSVNIGTLVSGANVQMDFVLTLEATPDNPPTGIATVSLRGTDTASPAAFLTATNPNISITGDPSSLWVNVHAAGDLVSITTLSVPLVRGRLPAEGE